MTPPPAGPTKAPGSKPTPKPSATKPPAKPKGTAKPGQTDDGGNIISGQTSGPNNDPAGGQIGTGGGPVSPKVAKYLLPAAAVLLLLLTALLLFAFFKRRRPDDGPQTASAVPAGGGFNPPRRAAVLPPVQFRGPLPQVPAAKASASALADPVHYEPANPLAVDEELLPRWRRPSLQQQRRTDPLRAAEPEANHLSFQQADGSAGPAAQIAAIAPIAALGTRRIRYRLVRLLDSPDEYRSTEIGVLDEGDEVQLLESQGQYWLVLCPDGRRGWIHRMTIADEPDTSAAAAQPSIDDFGVAYPIEEEELAQALAAPEVESGQPGGDSLLDSLIAARREALKGPTFSRPAQLPDAPVEAEPATWTVPSAHEPAAPSAEPEGADGQYSGRKRGGSRKAAGASRPGTRSRRPSQ